MGRDGGGENVSFTRVGCEGYVLSIFGASTSVPVVCSVAEERKGLLFRKCECGKLCRVIGFQHKRRFLAGGWNGSTGRTMVPPLAPMAVALFPCLSASPLLSVCLIIG